MQSMTDRTRNRVLAVLFIGVLMGALDIAIVGPALPAIRSTFGVGDRALAWIFSVYVLFNLIGTPLMAKLSDAFGRRSIYVLDVSLFALGSLWVALSPSFSLLLVGRAVQGLGAGGIFPVASAVIGDTFPPEKRGSALGLIGAVFGLAFLIGPLLAGVMLYFLSWHWLFLINLPIAALVITLSLRVLPSHRPARRRSFDWLGMATLGGLLAALAYGINRIDTEHFLASVGSLEVWPFLVTALVLIPVFILIEREAEDPVLRLELFESKQVVLASVLAVGTGLSEAAVVFVPALLVAAFGVSSSTASLMLLPVVLAMAIGSPLAGRMLDRSGSRAVLMTGMGVLTLGMVLAGFSSISLVAFYIAAILVGLGLSASLGAPLRYILLNETPPSERAAAQGALTLFISTGQLIGGALVGAVAASRGGGVAGYQTAYLVVGGIAFVMTLLTGGLKSRAEELATVRQREGMDAMPASPARPVSSASPTSLVTSSSEQGQ